MLGCARGIEKEKQEVERKEKEKKAKAKVRSRPRLRAAPVTSHCWLVDGYNSTNHLLVPRPCGLQSVSVAAELSGCMRGDIAPVHGPAIGACSTRACALQAMATALQTIGKFVIRKKVGEQDQIFGRCGRMACSAVAARVEQRGTRQDLSCS